MDGTIFRDERLPKCRCGICSSTRKGNRIELSRGLCRPVSSFVYALVVGKTEKGIAKGSFFNVNSREREGGGGGREKYILKKDLWGLWGRFTILR